MLIGEAEGEKTTFGIQSSKKGTVSLSVSSLESSANGTVYEYNTTRSTNWNTVTDFYVDFYTIPDTVTSVAELPSESAAIRIIFHV